MENPVNYNDLFSPTLQGDIDGLITKVKEVETTLTNMIATLTPKAQELANALSGSNSATSAGRSATKTAAAEVQQLYAVYEQLGLGVDYVQKNLASLIATQTAHNKATKDAEIVNKSNVDSITRLKAQIDLAKIALEGMTETQRKNSIEGQTLTNIIKTLGGQVKGYTDSIKGMASVSSAAASASASQQKGAYDLATSYSTLSTLMQQTGVNIETLITTQKQAEIAAKNGQVANTSLSGSYNQLAAQYNLIKLALNSMSAEMRNSTTVGKVWEAQAMDIMEQMKTMQAVTGNNKLEVGSYSKALNGLNIATLQVARELPVLSNSLSMFFIAISNNVPIFVEAFKTAQAELGSFGATFSKMLGMLKTQLPLLAILTVLPMITSAIHKRRKAQEEANKETEKAITYEELMAEAEKNAFQEVTNSTNKLKFLTKVLNDNTRSVDDRRRASKLLKQEFPEELKNFSTEDILAGKAKGSIEELTKALVIQAEAKAFLNEVGNLSVKLYNLEQKQLAAAAQESAEYSKQKILEAKVAAAAEIAKKTHSMGGGEWYGVNQLSNAVDEQAEVVAKAHKQWESYGKQMQDTSKAISDIEARINLQGLDKDFGADNTTKSTKEIADKIKEIPSYYNDALASVISIMEDGARKQLAQLDLSWKEEQEKRQEQNEELSKMYSDYEKQEAGLRKAGRADEIAKIEEQKKLILAEQSNLAFLLINEEQKYRDDRKAILDGILKDYKQEVADEGDVDEKSRQDIRTKLNLEKQIRDSAAYSAYEIAVNSGKDLSDAQDKLHADLLDSEKQYWQDYLKNLRDGGLLTVEEYNKIMDKMSKSEGGTDMSRGGSRRRGRKMFSNITEVAMAYSPIYGETKKYTDKDGNEHQFRQVKDEYIDYAAAVNDALTTSMEYMQDWMDKRIEMAQVAVDAAQKETDSAKSALDAEIEAKANGYANNVELARKEYAAKLKLQKDAVAEQKRLQKIQAAVDTAQQISSLVTATAELWKAYAGIPGAGPALAIAATALMWGSFLAAKIQAVQLANAKTTYGEGMTEYVNYGGSHASGNDVDFGRDKNGRQRTVERGEVIGVINKKNVSKYGVNKVMDIVASINNGTFDKKYSDAEKVASTIDIINAFSGSSGRANTISTANELTKIFNNSSSVLTDALPKGFGERAMEANYGMAFSGLSGDKTDLSLVEQGIRSLIEQGETKIVQTEDGRIEYKGNNKRIIHN
jgi:hypothetical protein